MALTAEVSYDDVKTAVILMHPDKSAGIDGLNHTFFQMFWSMVGHEVA